MEQIAARSTVLGKSCKRCGVYKPLEDFYEDKQNKDRRGSKCRPCMNEYVRERYLATKEYRDAYRKRWKELNPGKDYQYQKTCKMRKPEQYKEAMIQYTIKSRERRKEYHKEYAKRNADIIRKKRKDRYKNNQSYRIANVLRSRFRMAIYAFRKKKLVSSVKHLGCSIDYFMTYISNMFQPGMSWDNYGSVWHIDHIRPLSSFNLEDPLQQEEAVHYKNLQPLFAIDNLRKGSKYELQS